MSTITRRLQWLFPVEREVYKTWRVLMLNAEKQQTPCYRCGSPVRSGDVGFSTRARGSRFKAMGAHCIHRRCVPTAQFETAGLPARKVRRTA